MAREQEQLEDTLQRQRTIIVKRQEYQNAMVVEDLSAALQREI
jgi:hypothetical protein